MFELEIPEITDGVVMIKGVAREAGSRTKIAVYSRDESVDAVGSCIGSHGMRIDSIVSELGGEKIDIVKYSEVPEEYVSAALSPATVLEAEMTSERNRGSSIPGTPTLTSSTSAPRSSSLIARSVT